MRTAILLVSTDVSRRARPDRSGPELASAAEEAGCEIIGMEVVPHDHALVEDRLTHFVDEGAELVLTIGGTGSAPEHHTPEATWAVIERETPGIPEAIRASDRELLLLFRGIAGLAGSTLIVNLPGAPDAARRAFGAIVPLLARG
ncbi:MAG: molybdopterin-binding protein [Actinomycetota bacterium]|nr:molybdopterin-binding protein [Actinomycetota bacterium]